MRACFMRERKEEICMRWCVVNRYEMVCCDDIPNDMLFTEPPLFFFKILGESPKKVDDDGTLPVRDAIPPAALFLPVSLPEEEADINPPMSPVEPLVIIPPGLSIPAKICCPHPLPIEDEDDEMPCIVPRSSASPPRARASFRMTDGLSQSLIERKEEDEKNESKK